MIADVTLERSLYRGPSNKFEAVTGNIADVVGLGEALYYIKHSVSHEYALLSGRT